MNRTRIFLASPISGFQDEMKYQSYREDVLSLIADISDRYDVHSEIQEIEKTDSYDSHEDSVRKDFRAIDEADIFVFLHPIRMQSSTLIELGYACAKRKSLLLIGKKDDLPYMALGLTKPEFNVEVIFANSIDLEVIEKIKHSLNKLASSK